MAAVISAAAQWGGIRMVTVHSVQIQFQSNQSIQGSLIPPFLFKFLIYFLTLVPEFNR